MDFWLAFDQVEPIGEQWRQTAYLANLLERHLEFQMVEGSFEPSTVDSHMPARYVPEKKPKPKLEKPSDPASDFMRLGAAFGLTKVIATHGRLNQSS